MSSPLPAETMASVVALLPEAVLLAAADGRIRSANPRAAEMLDAAPAALEGRFLSEFTSEAKETLAAYLRACARSRAMVPGSLTLQNGEQRTPCRCEGVVLAPRVGDEPALVLLRLVPKEAAINRFVALNLRIDELNREIGRRQRAEDALREQRELLQVTLASIGDAVIATDATGAVTFINAVAEVQTGWTRSEALGRPLDEIFVIRNEATGAAVESPVATVLREGRVVGLANHTVLVARNGVSRPIDDSGAPIRDARGRILGVVLVFRDVTERRAFERERAEADRRKDEFLAMLAHELRNPLSVLANGVQLIRRGAGREGESRALAEAATAMERQVRHLGRLVDDLLDVSRLTTGKISLQRRPLPLETVLRNAIETLQPAIAARDIELSVVFAPEALLVDADATRLSQVFGNVLGNAVKFSAPGGRVRLASAEEDGWAVIRIADEGTGIAPEMLEAVFELFMQADTSLARARGGLGVGLTVAKLITEMHGGTIQAASAGVGGGSEFTVRLPLAGRQARAEPNDLAAAVPGRARAILVVDDNPDAAKTMALLLQLAGHQVHVAQDGEAALRLGVALRPEVILLDLGMPGMDGYEVARRLREQPETERALIIAVTGYGANADRRHSAAAGFDHHLVKPIEIEVLDRLIAGQR